MTLQADAFVGANFSGFRQLITLVAGTSGIN